MGKPTLVIIGAGLSGLSAACHALKNGYDTLVLDHGELPGGVCTAWERNGYTFDGAIQWLLGDKPGSALHGLYEELGITSAVKFLPISTLKRFVDEASGAHLDLTADLARFAADVRALSPQDGPLVDEIVEGVQAFEGYERPVEKAPDLAGPFDMLQSLWHSRRQLRSFSRFGMPVSELADAAVHPLVKTFLTRTFVPEIPAYYLLVLLAQLADGQLAVPEGGSYRLSSAVAQRALDLGARFHFGADVEEILIDNGKAVGVRLADGFEYRADAVISTAPGHTTLFRMLGGQYSDREMRDRYLRWPIFPGIALVSFGLRTTFPDAPSLWTVRLEEPVVQGHYDVEHALIRTFGHDPTLAPPGCSSVQLMMEADYDFWTEMHHTQRRYSKAKSDLVQKALDIVDRHLPGARAHVEVADVATPYTFWRFARSYRGAYEGWLPTTEALKTKISKKLPGLDRFYMAGQWVEPGGGVPPALLSGRQAVELLCHDQGKPFV
ncbi:phytoene desaturase family protein [Polyangium aurulentum]|uniref:phytoene desaturase family protein n=1 Tax=Polyangium aurulentum TaxID=2567896 RepID=UPI0010ADA5EA|nr:NAD(P)/FAD-dependent oxidoreductase [Polyangium aurulentum]UQA58424.1 NAD(P)/FAD-dependent oxidoreductase [Polyangium aurulentum]